MARKGKVSDRFKNKKAQKSSRSAYKTLEIRQRFLIICEGEKTEPFYFESLEKHLKPGVAIIAKGEGRNTLTLVDQAISEQKRLEKRGEAPDVVWVVMDRDSFPAANFDNAIAKCEAQSFRIDKKSKSFKCAWSNESFELWLLLHFDNQISAIGRHDINSRLTAHFGFRYDKSLKEIYQIVRDSGGDESLALRRAEALYRTAQRPYSQANPATHVFKLVEELNKYKK